jgi:hypothetical protein
VVVFAALAAVGAGLAVAADAVVDHVDERVAALSVAVPVAAYLLGLALIMALTGRSPQERAVTTKVAGAIVVTVIGVLAPVPATVAGCGAVLAALVLLMVLTAPEPGTV